MGRQILILLLVLLLLMMMMAAAVIVRLLHVTNSVLQCSQCPVVKRIDARFHRLVTTRARITTFRHPDRYSDRQTERQADRQDQANEQSSEMA